MSYPSSGSYPPGNGQQAGGYPPGYGQQAGSYPPQGQPAEDDGEYSDDPSDGQGSPPGTPTPEAAAAPPEVDNYKPSDLSGLQAYDGYGDVGFEGGEFLPPPPPPVYEEQQAPSMEFGKAADITEDEARTALLEYVAENCCFGKGAAEKMEVRGILPSNAMHYTLETFCEGRTTARTEVPYRGEVLDGAFNGPPPLPWDIPCSPASQFNDQIYKLTVPHTEEVRTCGMCIGCGFVRCGHCCGRGRRRCNWCHGRGRRRKRSNGETRTITCNWCHGSGRRMCNRCVGSGRVVCPHCEGQGRVKNFIQLTVTFINHVTDYILEETAMPDHLVRSVSGVEVFGQVLPQVQPITTFPVKHVNDNSIRLVERAKHAYPTEQQLNQRQTLRAVPVTEVHYSFKDTATRFWVYGMQRKVYSPDYPQQCCWGCNIL